MWKQNLLPMKWTDMLAEASDALARLDAERLEEMALSCAALVRENHPEEHRRAHSEGWNTRQGGNEMAKFAGVLKATRTNLDVLRRLRRAPTQLEYGLTLNEEAATESGHGDR